MWYRTIFISLALMFVSALGGLAQEGDGIGRRSYLDGVGAVR